MPQFVDNLAKLIRIYLRLETALNEDDIRVLISIYDKITKTEGAFGFEYRENKQQFELLKELGMIREFPKKSDFYIPVSPSELYQKVLNKITDIYRDSDVQLKYVFPLEGIIVKDWKKENLEKLKSVANNLIKNWNDDVIICARRLTPFEPEVIVDKLEQGKKVRILLVYSESKKSFKNIAKEAIAKICKIYTSIETSSYLKNLSIRHTNLIGDQFRFLKTGDVTILVLGSIEKTHYDAIVIENERFSAMIQDIFDTYFMNASKINIRKLCNTPDQFHSAKGTNNNPLTGPYSLQNYYMK